MLPPRPGSAAGRPSTASGWESPVVAGVVAIEAARAAEAEATSAAIWPLPARVRRAYAYGCEAVEVRPSICSVQLSIGCGTACGTPRAGESAGWVERDGRLVWAGMSARGQVLAGRYRLVAPLATDGVEAAGDRETVAWMADDLRLERRVRVALPRAEYANDAAARERFWARARGAAHGSGVAGPRVLDAGTDAASGQSFLIWEWQEPAAVAAAHQAADTVARLSVAAARGSTERGKAEPAGRQNIATAHDAADAAARPAAAPKRNSTEPTGRPAQPAPRGATEPSNVAATHDSAEAAASPGVASTRDSAEATGRPGRTAPRGATERPNVAATHDSAERPDLAATRDSAEAAARPSVAPARGSADAAGQSGLAAAGGRSGMPAAPGRSGMAGAPRGPKATTRRGTLRRTAPGWRPGRWPLIGGAVVGLAVAGAGVSNWLAWVNEPLAQQRSAFSLAFAPAVQVPAVGAQSGQATATAVAPPPTVSAAARAVAANATPTPPAASTAGATGAPGATAVATAARTAGNTVAASNAATATVTARSAATPAARSTAQATAAADSALGNRRRIVNTDGAGVALRSGPDGDRLRGKGYDEGVSVTILERSGPWTHIRGDDGRDGWIPTVTLTP